VSGFTIEYYDETDSVWKELSDFWNLKYTFSNGELQLAPSAKFVTDKDEQLNAHQKVRIFEVG